MSFPKFKVFTCIAFLALLFSFSLAALSSTGYQGETTAYQGRTKVTALAFTTAGGTFTSVKITNSSSSVPFGSDVNTSIIYTAYLYKDNNGDRRYDAGDTLVISSGAFPGVITQWASSSFAPQAAGDYIILYDVSAKATAGYTTSAKLDSLNDGSTDIVPGTGGGPYTISILATGLVYGDTGTMISTSTNVAPGLTDLPVYKFYLEASNVTLNLTSITIHNPNNNFCTVSNPAGGIKKVRLMAESSAGSNSFSGILNETDLGQIDLSTLGNVNSVTFTFAPILLTNSYGSSSSTANRYFYVLYDIGDAFPAGSSAGVAIGGAEATQVPGPGTASLQGTLPGGAISFQVKDANVILRSCVKATTMNYITTVLAGQRKLRLVDFVLRVNENITNATVKIVNNEGTFDSSFPDTRISKVALYQDDPVKGAILLAATNTFASASTCYLTNVNLAAGNNQQYHIEYDVGAYLTATANSYKVACQFGGVSGGNSQFSGSVDAPSQPPTFNVSPRRIWVEYVSVNTTEVVAGQTFEVELGVRNMYSIFDPPILSNTVLVRALCQPKFYADDISGRDLSTEYSAEDYLPVGYTDPFDPLGISNVPAFITTINYTVDTTGLKTNGWVKVDAQIGYINNSNPSYPLDTLLARMRISSSQTLPAAMNYNNGGGPTDSTKYIHVSGVAQSRSSFPSYVTAVYSRQDNFPGTTEKRFVNKDVVTSGGYMRVLFNSPGLNLDNGVTVKLNGTLLNPVSDYTMVVNTTTNTLTELNNLPVGSTNGTFLIASNEGSFSINYSVDGGSDLISNLLAYPSPWDPDSGNCQIGFEVNQGCTYSVYIYDASGDLVTSEKDLKANFGYNIYPWEGINKKSSKKVGRGVYLVKIVAEGKTKQEIKTKIGVK